MRIVLRPMDAEVPEGIVAVGEVDGLPLGFRGREPHVLSQGAWRPLPYERIAEAFLKAVIDAASATFGDMWVAPLARVAMVGHRTCQRDRIVRYGLPVPVMRLLGDAASSPMPRATGYALLMAAEHAGKMDGPMTRRDWDGVHSAVASSVPATMTMLSGVRDEAMRVRLARLAAQEDRPQGEEAMPSPERHSAVQATAGAPSREPARRWHGDIHGTAVCPDDLACLDRGVSGP